MKQVCKLAVVCVALLGITARSGYGAEDVLVRAVGFAITGNDNTEPKIIDRKNCVFKIGNDTYYLDNVQTDRLAFQKWKSTSGPYQEWTTVDLHGDDVIAIEIHQPIAFNGTEVEKSLKKSEPSLFKPSKHQERQMHLTLWTSDEARVIRAWKYIYSHGCSGKLSPF